MPKTLFRPISDGFAFVNAWTFDEVEQDRIRATLTVEANQVLSIITPLLGSTVPALSGVLTQWIDAGRPATYGLCGGMAFAALDYYRAGLIVPQGTGRMDQPTGATPEGATLREYLTRRMLDSLSTGGAGTTCLRWMAFLHLVPSKWPFLGGPGWLLDQSRNQWSTLKSHLDAGTPWPISLVGETKDPFSNHQVLAYGYDDPGDGTGTIYVYDVNCPGHENTIQLDFRRRRLNATESCAPGARGQLRGFFCAAYSPVRPPDMGLKYGALQKEHSRPDVFLVCGGARFLVPAGALGELGYAGEWVRDVPDGTLAAWPTTPVDATLLQELPGGGIYVVYGGAKLPIQSLDDVRAVGLSPVRIRALPAGALASIPTTPADGTLFRGQSRPGIYLFRNGRRLRIRSQARFDELGLSRTEIKVVPDSVLTLFGDGGIL